MKLLFMGSIPTFRFDEQREVSEQEVPFTHACQDMGFQAARNGHTVLLANEHPSGADMYVAKGIAEFAAENPDKQVAVEVNRPEGSELIFSDLPENISVERRFHAELDRTVYGHGTLIPCLAALDASDVLVAAGGKLTVRLMGNIAADRDKAVLAIPTFGGSSAELYDRLKYLYKSAFKEQLSDLSVLQSVWTPDAGERTIALAETLAAKGGDTSAHSYFVSYTWDESHVADHIEVLLQRNRRAVNRDESIFAAGADLSDVVKSLIQESDTFIGLWSERFKKSTWCPHELEYALNRMSNGLRPHRVILITLDDTEPPIRFVGKLRLPGADREQRDLSIRRLVEEETDS